jgi:uncharacterized membrane protein YhhN
MVKKAKYIFGLFIVVSTAHVLGLSFNIEIVSLVTKPLILISLLTYYLKSTHEKSILYIGAVLFSLLGDVLLLSNAELSFILGLASFLIAHLLYIVMVLKKIETSSFTTKVKSIVPFVILCFGLIYFLRDILGGMLIPVTIYATIISLFGTVSLLNYRNNKSNKALTLLFGALFFILSDGLLAINKFYESNAVYSVIVMITYITAQYLICSYKLKEDKV